MQFLKDSKNINLFHMFVVAVLLYLVTTDKFPENIVDKNTFLRYLALYVFLFHAWLYYKKTRTEGYCGMNGDYYFGGQRGVMPVERVLDLNVAKDENVHHVRMFDSDPGYSTPKLVVKQGDVVVGEVEHTVTSARMDRYAQGIMEPSYDFNSGYMKPGATFAVKFEHKGTFPYYCLDHKGWMQGVVIVK